MTTPLIMLHHCLRIPLGLVFVGTGLIKLIDLAEFARHLGDFGIVADAFVPVAAWIVALTELMAGLGLLANLRGSLALVLCLLLLFIGVLSYGIVLGLDIECGCLGPTFSLGLEPQLLLDVALLSWCALIYWSDKRYKTRVNRPPSFRVKTSDSTGNIP